MACTTLVEASPWSAFHCSKFGEMRSATYALPMASASGSAIQA